MFDFGNTRLKWGVRNGDGWTTARINNSDPRLMSQNLDREFVGLGVPEQVWISSVTSKESTQALCDWIERRWQLAPSVIQSSASCCGVRNTYKQPETLGSDRWAALVAVRHRFESPACIIDCGTAITVDMLDKEGSYRGGVIFPGLALSRSSLVRNTSKLQIGADEAVNCLADSTSAGILSGTFTGTVGAIEKIVECQQRRADRECSIYVTGGDGEIIAGSLGLQCSVVEDLVLQGLEVISVLDS